MSKMFIAHDPCLNIVQFQKVWYPWNQLIEIFQILPVPKKLRKMSAPYSKVTRTIATSNLGHVTLDKQNFMCQN